MNIETVPCLYHTVRLEAIYERSLELLRRVSTFETAIPAKSGLLLGLGETPAEIRAALEDIYETGCKMLTLGQYLQPSKGHLSVERFVTPDEFDQWRKRHLRSVSKKLSADLLYEAPTTPKNSTRRWPPDNP